MLVQCLREVQKPIRGKLENRCAFIYRNANWVYNVQVHAKIIVEKDITYLPLKSDLYSFMGPSDGLKFVFGTVNGFFDAQIDSYNEFLSLHLRRLCLNCPTRLCFRPTYHMIKIRRLKRILKIQSLM